jgi:hypothetical protein
VPCVAAGHCISQFILILAQSDDVSDNSVAVYLPASGILYFFAGGVLVIGVGVAVVLRSKYNGTRRRPHHQPAAGDDATKLASSSNGDGAPASLAPRYALRSLCIAATSRTHVRAGNVRAVLMTLSLMAIGTAASL